jgi:tRNA 2-thiocytidine biosynthesis protein TtcA
VKGNLLNALANVVPSHLLDRELQRSVAEATGKDPWLDADEDEGETCEPPDVVRQPRTNGRV